MVTVRIHNAYSDGHESTHEVEVAVPAGPLEEWWEDEVWPETGDGHGADNEDLGTCYTATIILAEDLRLLGANHEWVSS